VGKLLDMLWPPSKLPKADDLYVVTGTFSYQGTMYEQGQFLVIPPDKITAAMAEHLKKPTPDEVLAAAKQEAFVLLEKTMTEEGEGKTAMEVQKTVQAQYKQIEQYLMDNAGMTKAEAKNAMYGFMSGGKATVNLKEVYDDLLATVPKKAPKLMYDQNGMVKTIPKDPYHSPDKVIVGLGPNHDIAYDLSKEFPWEVDGMGTGACSLHHGFRIDLIMALEQERQPSKHLDAAFLMFCNPFYRVLPGGRYRKKNTSANVKAIPPISKHASEAIRFLPHHWTMTNTNLSTDMNSAKVEATVILERVIADEPRIVEATVQGKFNYQKGGMIPEYDDVLARAMMLATVLAYVDDEDEHGGVVSLGLFYDKH